MTKEKDTLEAGKRLDKTFGQQAQSQYQFVDRNFRRISHLQVTSPTLEPDAQRHVAYVDGKYKSAYFVNYDETKRLSTKEIEEKIALKQLNRSEAGFLCDKQGNYYNKAGYLLIEQEHIKKNGNEFFYANPNEKKLDFSKKVEQPPGSNLFMIGETQYEKKGDYYYDFWDKNKAYTANGQPLQALKNPFIGERFPITDWKFYNGFTYIEFPLDLSLNPSSSDKVFYLQTSADFPDSVKTLPYTLTTYDPTTNEPLDKTQITLYRVNDGKMPATFRSEPLVANALRVTTYSRMESDQFKAFPGSKLSLTYPSLDGGMTTVSLGRVSSQKVVEIDLVIYKDGHEKANLEASKAQLAKLKEDLAVAGIQIKVVTKTLDIPAELEFASAEKLAVHSRQYFSNPKGITMIMGAGNEGKHFTAGNNNFPNKAGNGFFVSGSQDQYKASILTTHILEVTSAYKTPASPVNENSELDAARIKILHLSPLLTKPEAQTVNVAPSQPVLAH